MDDRQRLELYGHESDIHMDSCSLCGMSGLEEVQSGVRLCPIWRTWKFQLARLWRCLAHKKSPRAETRGLNS